MIGKLVSAYRLLNGFQKLRDGSCKEIPVTEIA